MQYKKLNDPQAALAVVLIHLFAWTTFTLFNTFEVKSPELRKEQYCKKEE